MKIYEKPDVKIINIDYDVIHTSGGGEETTPQGTNDGIWVINPFNSIFEEGICDEN